MTSLLVAAVGVVGTLGAAVLTQTRADRLKRLELEHAAAQRAEDREHAEMLRQAEEVRARQQENLSSRRSCYVSVNTAARQYMTALRNHLHAVRRESEMEASSERLEACRAAHRASYAEAQMIVPFAVLESLRVANAGLNAAYGKLKRVERQDAEPGESLQEVQDSIPGLWECLSEMRWQMRRDLGIDPEPDGEE
ncbi:hypothetical protein VM95_21390 [Streptomyces rubellomurinus]|uniref:Uncharacterized protein n=1 Tax=Streptomyces rubellomurinus (strain ATCC 31215) TaxID=359131 RepID=A0A0F2TFA2_STRR3|nr:hypothetical protein VM95_21390 [Streptomyces rubellomurinus]